MNRKYFCRVRKKDSPLVQLEYILDKAVAKCLKIIEKEEQSAKAGIKIPVDLALKAFEVTGLHAMSNYRTYTPPNFNMKNRIYYHVRKDEACALGAICAALKAPFLEDSYGAWNDREVAAFLHRMSFKGDLELDISSARNISVSYVWGYTFGFDGRIMSQTAGWVQSMSNEYTQGYEDGKAALEALGDDVLIYDDLAAEVESGYYNEEDLEWVKRPPTDFYGPGGVIDASPIREHLVVGRSVTVEEQQANLARAFQDFTNKQIKERGLENSFMDKLRKKLDTSIAKGENLELPEQLLLEMTDVYADATQRTTSIYLSDSDEEEDS